VSHNAELKKSEDEVDGEQEESKVQPKSQPNPQPKTPPSENQVSLEVAN
jgi:hypothetical protein